MRTRRPFAAAPWPRHEPRRPRSLAAPPFGTGSCTLQTVMELRRCGVTVAAVCRIAFGKPSRPSLHSDQCQRSAHQSRLPATVGITEARGGGFQRCALDLESLHSPAGVNDLTLLRRPAIGLGAGAAHQHCPLTVAQTVGLAEGL